MYLRDCVAVVFALCATFARTQEVTIDIFNTGGCSTADGGESESVTVYSDSCTDFGQPGVLSYTDPGLIPLCTVYGSPDCQNECVGTPSISSDCVDLNK